MWRRKFDIIRVRQILLELTKRSIKLSIYLMIGIDSETSMMSKKILKGCIISITNKLLID